MNINDKNSSMWNLLNQSYMQQNTKTNSTSGNTSGYSNHSNSVFSTQNKEEISGISSLFDLGSTAQTTTQTEIQDSFEKSQELSNLQNFAKNFSQSLANNLESLGNLGNAMWQNGILNQEEKIGFNVLYKLNPSLDSAQTQNLLQNSNLSKEVTNLLSQVDSKVSAVRYFGGF